MAKTKEKIDLVKHTPYDYVVADTSMFDSIFPDTKTLGDSPRPEYRLVQAIYDRRTKQPVAWIFGREPAPASHP
ncbi:MAG TPA: hypothetical protein VMT60_00525 [Candidatus Bathyarchaeia archaeon]|nr:hypothetical protein [Candidatus Bathyarchaeia archaeon]